MHNQLPKIGFIGTGVMGKSMADNLMDAGYPLIVHTRTKTKADELIAKGATWKDTVGEVAAEADVTITIVGYPSDVEEVFLGAEGIVAHAKRGSYIIDMTTSSPRLAQRIFESAQSKGIHALDAPVSGGDIGAQNGTLAIMVGGEQEAFDEMKPIFDRMGENIILQGKAGAGQHTKLSNQIAIASNMIGVCEAIVYAKKAGLDPSRVLDTITTGGTADKTRILYAKTYYGKTLLNNQMKQ